MKKKKSRGSKVAVTFEARDVQAENLAVAGDFNDWSTSATPMKRQKDNMWAVTVNLVPGTYRYRYVADGSTWLNDPDAESYEPSGLGEDNSIVQVEPM